MNTPAPVAGRRLDRYTGQYVPTINGKDTSPTSFDEDRALQIAREQIAAHSVDLADHLFDLGCAMNRARSAEQA